MKKKKILLFLIIIILNFDQKLKANEKNCFFCKEYKYLKDWPEEKRPKAYIYEKINYPKDMFDKATLEHSHFIKNLTNVEKVPL